MELEEMQMLLNSGSMDIDYLVYLILKDGSYFDYMKTTKEEKNEAIVPDLDSWFDSI